MDETRHPGFTLLELLVTLAVAALLAGLAVPAMARLIDNARLAAASEALSQELRLARNHAISHQQTVYFSVSASPRQWCFGWSDRADCDCRSGATAARSCRTGENGLYRIHRQGSTDFPSIRLDTLNAPGPRTIRFSPQRGTASADSFRLNNKSSEVRIIVSPLGRVRSCSPHSGRFPPC